MARPAGFEPTTPWFVAKYSIQLSYGRMLVSSLANTFALFRYQNLLFAASIYQIVLAEREGFEPSISFLSLYSLSRGAPSTTRPSLHERSDRIAVYRVRVKHESVASQNKPVKIRSFSFSHSILSPLFFYSGQTDRFYKKEVIIHSMTVHFLLCA